MLLRLIARLRTAGRHMRIGWHAWHHPALRWPGRLGLLALALYVISPIDLIPEGIPLLGWLDDLLVISCLLPLLLQRLPPEVLRSARQRAGEVN